MPTDQQLTTADLANTANGNENDYDTRSIAGAARARDNAQEHTEPLLPHDFSDEMRTRWEGIQTEFVDDPRVSVQRADELVASAIQKLAQSFADERAKLEQQWSKGSDVNTEDLRQALRRYRAFFHRLLAV